MDGVTKRDIGWLIGLQIASFTAAGLGALVSASAVKTWYPGLSKPGWTPPGAVFAPVWTVLYFTIGLSAWFVRRTVEQQPERAPVAQAAFAAWLVQLGLNVLWSVVFFGQRRIGAGLVTIIGLWVAVVGCVVLSARVWRPAGIILVPYLAWISFAAVLNGRIWQLNRR
jgi:translocator protein